jgi:hypothetical protein
MHDGVQEVVVLDRMNFYFRNEGHKLESPFPTTKALCANYQSVVQVRVPLHKCA